MPVIWLCAVVQGTSSATQYEEASPDRYRPKVFLRLSGTSRHSRMGYDASDTGRKFFLPGHCSLNSVGPSRTHLMKPRRKVMLRCKAINAFCTWPVWHSLHCELLPALAVGTGAATPSAAHKIEQLPSFASNPHVHDYAPLPAHPALTALTE